MALLCRIKYYIYIGYIPYLIKKYSSYSGYLQNYRQWCHWEGIGGESEEKKGKEQRVVRKILFLGLEKKSETYITWHLEILSADSRPSSERVLPQSTLGHFLKVFINRIIIMHFSCIYHRQKPLITYIEYLPLKEN